MTNKDYMPEDNKCEGDQDTFDDFIKYKEATKPIYSQSYVDKLNRKHEEQLKYQTVVAYDCAVRATEGVLNAKHEAELKAQREANSLKSDIACDREYVHGLKAGWNLCEDQETDKFKRIIKNRMKAAKEAILNAGDV